MPLLLFVAFIIVPLAELYVITQIAAATSWPVTLITLLVVSVAGAWLVKREGRAAWQRFRSSVGQPRLPAVEVVDGALVLIGGTLLLTPGFLTDIAGLLFVVPPTRAVINRAIRRRARRTFGLPGSARFIRVPPRDPAPDDAPVDVEVLEVRRSPNGQRP